MSQDYDLERLKLFINTYGFRFNPKPETPDPGLLHAAACALMDALWYGADLKKELGIAKKRGQRGKGKAGSKVKQRGRVVTETARYLTGNQSYTQAVEKITEIRRITPRKAQNEIRDARGSAESLINSVLLIQSAMQKKDR